MPSLERPEISGNPGHYPEGVSFAKLLKWHLDFGTRPDGRPEAAGKSWSNKEFAKAVGGVTDKTVRNWLNESVKRLNDFPSVETALFGKNTIYNMWRIELRTAYNAGANTEPSAIPPPPVHFLGRDRDIAAVLDVLLASATAQAILVQGGPGIGKTSLTRAVGNHPDVVERFGEAHRWFVELDTATTAVAMQDGIARAIGVDPALGFKATLTALKARPGLLVLDNLETPWDPSDERQKTQETLAALAAIPDLATLASFRGRDRIGGVAWALVHSVERLNAPYDSQLFQRVAGKTFDGDPSLPLFMAALDGIPLALELVAARAYGRTSLASLWDEWTRIGVELAAHPDFEAGRLTSLPHSIELSLKSSRLTPAAFRLFRFLGQLPAGLIAEDRDALLCENGFKAEEALLRIGLAVERFGRLDLLSPVREHALRHHKPVALDQETWPAHFLVLTERRGETIGTREGEGGMARLAPELNNIEAAFRAVLKVGRREDAMAALHGLGRMTHIGALPTPVLMELADACRLEGDAIGEADCIFALGTIANARFNNEGARDAFERALPLYQIAGSVLGEANCIHGLGKIALLRSDHDRARDTFETALPLYKTAGDVLGEANCIKSLGEIALRRTDHDGARAAFEKAQPLFQTAGYVPGEAMCIFLLGVIALAHGNHKAALAAFEMALPLFTSGGNVLGEANCIRRFGDIALARTEHEIARTAYNEALPLYRTAGDVLGEANCIKGLGDLSLACTEYQAARIAYETALPLYQTDGNIQGEAECIKGFGDVALASTNHEAAYTAYEKAVPLFRTAGDVLGEANCIKGFGDIALAQMDRAGARACYEQALPLYQKSGNAIYEAACLKALHALGGS